MSSDFFNLRNCYNRFQTPTDWENPSQCVDTLNWLNRKIIGESMELFNINVLLGNPQFTNSCSVSPIWQDWYAGARIGVFAILLLFYVLVIPVLCIRARRRTRKAGRIVGLFGYGLGVVCMVLYLSLAIIADAFLNCIKIGDEDYFKLYMAGNILSNAANVIILGVLLLPLMRRVMHHGGYGAAFPTIVHLILLFLVGALFIVAVVLYNLGTVNAFSGIDVLDNNFGTQAAYVTMYLIATISGGFWVNHAVSGMWKNGRSTHGVTPWANLLAFSFIIFACIPVVLVYGWKVYFRTYTRVASFAFVTIMLFFQAYLYALVALVAGGRGLDQTPKQSPRLKSADTAPAIPPMILDRRSLHPGVDEDGYLTDEEAAIGSRRHSRRRSGLSAVVPVPGGHHHKVHEKHPIEEEEESNIDSDDDDFISSIHSSDIDDISSVHTGDSVLQSHVGTMDRVSRVHSSDSHTDVDEISAPAHHGGGLNSHPTGRFREHMDDAGSVKYA